jgi:hypothetical protein
MAQVRAVMPSKFVPLADELLEVTGVGDYSTLISLLLSRYGNHLRATWQITNCSQPAPTIPPPYAEVSISAPEPFAPMDF